MEPAFDFPGHGDGPQNPFLRPNNNPFEKLTRGEVRRKVPLEHQRGQLHVNKQTKKYVGSSELNVRELDLHSRYIYLCTLLLQASHPFLRPLWNDFKCKYIHTSVSLHSSLNTA